MRLCSMCGASIPENSAFCTECGARYESADASPPNHPGFAGQAESFSSQGMPQSAAPMNQLKTNRSLIKFILFSIITLGIYVLVFHHGISRDTNTIASRYDGKKTFNYVIMFLLIIVGSVAIALAAVDWGFVILSGGMIAYRSSAAEALSALSTFFFALPLYVWYHRVTGRIGAELSRRGINNDFSTPTYWKFYGAPAMTLLLLNTITTVAGVHIPILFWGGSGVIIILSFVYFHKLCVAFNQLAEHYNVHG